MVNNMVSLFCASIRWEVLLGLVTRLQAIWCKSFGILPWNHLKRMTRKTDTGWRHFARNVMIHCLDCGAANTCYWSCFSDSLKMPSESAETARSNSCPLSNLPNTFAFKIQDKKGRMHRFNCGMPLYSAKFSSSKGRMDRLIVFHSWLDQEFDPLGWSWDLDSCCFHKKLLVELVMYIIPYHFRWWYLLGASLLFNSTLGFHVLWPNDLEFWLWVQIHRVWRISLLPSFRGWEMKLTATTCLRFWYML